MDLQYEFIASFQKKHPLLLLDGYTFARIGNNRLWYCSKRWSLECKAQVRMDHKGLHYELIPSNRKKDLLLLEQHTFAQIGYKRLWYCSKKTKLGCKAQVRMDESGTVIYYRNDHNHDPPRLHKTTDGRYVKL
ncbi:hypothetical protein EVAR_42944_1 [Eumeta japonica]|uniref:FLYWCH-type domain-containing protein n=1 Tax=Eumeta variegata TaxID=151549 RepID=A0A4C1YG55_EUMVA|nr:hypothetical protein EVAR_42944_1 [Eumeta japonica]